MRKQDDRDPKILPKYVINKQQNIGKRGDNQYIPTYSFTPFPSTWARLNAQDIAHPGKSLEKVIPFSDRNDKMCRPLRRVWCKVYH